MSETLVSRKLFLFIYFHGMHAWRSEANLRIDEKFEFWEKVIKISFTKKFLFNPALRWYNEAKWSIFDFTNFFVLILEEPTSQTDEDTDISGDVVWRFDNTNFSSPQSFNRSERKAVIQSMQNDHSRHKNTCRRLPEVTQDINLESWVVLK